MEINELYQELIIDHGTAPRNFYKLEGATHQAEGFNPLCGDKIELYLIIDNNIIKSVSFQGQGCAISTASASIMTELLPGKTLEQAQAIFAQFQELVTTKAAVSPGLGKLAALAGVYVFPSRVKCATLAWHTLLSALVKDHKIATTE